VVRDRVKAYIESQPCHDRVGHAPEAGPLGPSAQDSQELAGYAFAAFWD